MSQQNSQSGTQWDGMRHFGLIEHDIFYNKCVVSFYFQDIRAHAIFRL